MKPRCPVGSRHERPPVPLQYNHPVKRETVDFYELVERALEGLPPELAELLDNVAIVVDGPRFLGLITRIDLLNWLRRRVH